MPGRRSSKSCTSIRPGADWPAFAVAAAPLDAGQLRGRGARTWHSHGTSVGIVTGFCAVADAGVTAETDGPPGALFLARRSAGARHRRRVDHRSLCAAAAWSVGCDLLKLDRDRLLRVSVRKTRARPTATCPRSDIDAGALDASDRVDRATVASDRHRAAGPSHTLDRSRRNAPGRASRDDLRPRCRPTDRDRVPQHARPVDQRLHGKDASAVRAMPRATAADHDDRHRRRRQRNRHGPLRLGAARRGGRRQAVPAASPAALPPTSR